MPNHSAPTKSGVRRPIVFGDPENRCYGCGPKNSQGLQLQFYETDEGVEIDYLAPPHLEGPPGIIHGGVQATVLDEALCMTAYAKLGTPVVTGELTVRYLHPAPIGTSLVVRGRIVERKMRSVMIEGGIYLAADGKQLTRAHGRFFLPADAD